MPKIQSVATAVPAYQVEQGFVREFASEVFKDRIAGLERLLPLFENSGIERRFVVAPPSWYRQQHDLAERSELYTEAATELSRITSYNVCYTKLLRILCDSSPQNQWKPSYDLIESIV